MKKHYVRPFNESLLVFLICLPHFQKRTTLAAKLLSLDNGHKPVPAWLRWLEAIMNDMCQIFQRPIESLNLPLTS